MPTTLRIAFLLAAAVLAPASMNRLPLDRPRVDYVEPDIARPYMLVTAYGSNLN
jgi:hypothetical protein